MFVVLGLVVTCCDVLCYGNRLLCSVSLNLIFLLDSFTKASSRKNGRKCGSDVFWTESVFGWDEQFTDVNKRRWYLYVNPSLERASPSNTSMCTTDGSISGSIFFVGLWFPFSVTWRFSLFSCCVLLSLLWLFQTMVEREMSESRWKRILWESDLQNERGLNLLESRRGEGERTTGRLDQLISWQIDRTVHTDRREYLFFFSLNNRDRTVLRYNITSYAAWWESRTRTLFCVSRSITRDEPLWQTDLRRLRLRQCACLVGVVGGFLFNVRVILDRQAISLSLRDGNRRGIEW